MTVSTDVHFAIVPEWVLFSDVSAQAVRVYAVLARFADRETDVAFPGRKTISLRARCSVSTVQRSVAELVEIGAVEVRTRKVDGRAENDTNEYVLRRIPPDLRGRVTGEPTSTAGEPTGRVTGEPTVGSPVTRELEPENESQENENSRPSRSDAAEKAGPNGRALVELLVELVVANGSKRPEPTAAWYDAARLLLTADKRKLDEAERLLRWSQDDEFWRGNVLSLPTFRRQYDRLRLAATRGGPRRGPVDKAAAIARLEDRRRARRTG